MAEKLTTAIYAFISLFLITFISEYSLLRLHAKWRPSITIAIIADYAQELFIHIGKFAAWLSSFYTFIDMTDIIRAFMALFEPTWDFLTSWTYFFYGYIEYMNIFQYPYLIIFGSLTLFVLAIIACYKLKILHENSYIGLIILSLSSVIFSNQVPEEPVPIRRDRRNQN